MRRVLAVLLMSQVLPAAAVAQSTLPGMPPPAPPVIMLPPASPPAPVPSVVTPSAPLPGVTLRSGPTTYPSSGYVTPSYRSKAVKKPRCKKRRGRRCHTS